MTRAYLQPKDALVLCTVSVLFIYFGLVLWTNYEIIVPYWTPLFWAAALSVPTHALKTRLLPPLHEAFENDIMDIVASSLGGVVIFIIRFFLGSHVAHAIRTTFRGYCYIIYMVCDGRPREVKKGKVKEPVHEDSVKEEQWGGEINGSAHYRRTPIYDLEGTQLDRIDSDDYELHPTYQTLVDQEPDKYARPPSFPSYINLLRAALIYGLLQITTPADLWSFVKERWSEVQFGTSTQLTYLVLAIIVHMQFVCMRQVVSMVERIIYPNLSPEELEEQSLLNTVPRMIRKAVQESLNSTLATVVVFTTLSAIGSLAIILAFGVAHDVQGVLAQTHQRVTTFRELQLQREFQGAIESEYEAAAKSPFVGQADEALSQAYNAGVSWFDPLLKDAFPDLAWGATDWAFHIANVIVELDQDQRVEKAVVIPPGACKAEVKIDPDLAGLMTQHAAKQSSLDDLAAPSPPLESAAEDKNDEEEVQVETPELWVIPTLESLGFSGLKLRTATTFLAPKHKQTAINISQAKFLTSIILGYKGLDTSTMLSGFNAFNDLLFRWILFLLGLLTFTGLKVSPLQRIGWIIDQALASHTSQFGSSRLAVSASPGRVIAKSVEFAISGTFVSMLKLSVYHTIFTLIWTQFLTQQVMPLVAVGTASSDFVPVKYAWLTSLFGIVLVLFPIAPNWLVSLPGGIIHFYIYGQRPMEAIAMVLGHVAMASVVDGAVWNSHVVKYARPTVSSAFWLGLWTFLGGMKWGPKGLLLGPVFFAAVPSIWSALLELRGRPLAGGSHAGGKDSRFARVPAGAGEAGREHSRDDRWRYREKEEDEYEINEGYYSRHRRSSSGNKSRSRSSARKVDGHRR